MCNYANSRENKMLRRVAESNARQLRKHSEYFERLHSTSNVATVSILLHANKRDVFSTNYSEGWNWHAMVMRHGGKCHPFCRYKDFVITFTFTGSGWYAYRIPNATFRIRFTARIVRNAEISDARKSKTILLRWNMFISVQWRQIMHWAEEQASWSRWSYG